MKKKLILASASPRRKEILEQMGLTFAICPASGEERLNTEDPEEAVKAHMAQYAPPSATAGSTAHLPHHLRSKRVTAVQSIPMCRPETAKTCAMPPVRVSSARPLSIPFILPVSRA